ncbi:MAG: ABC transporter substrate-binding protein [Proteobacteria bacterium]|nr:ABC transporter substrate-binding protein [Pseudomonadota bacterium]
MNTLGVFRAFAVAAVVLALPAGVEAQPSGELTIALSNLGREHLDLGIGTSTDLIVNGHPFDGLIGTAPGGELSAERGLAESWQMNNDATVLTVKLRRGVKWHDGKPLTADDVVFSFGERYVAKDAICVFCGALKKELKKVEAVDDYTVRFHLNNPDPTFAGILSSRDGNFRVLARHNFKKTADGYEFAGSPIGSGPWKFVSFQRGVELRFAANTEYWDKSRIPEFATMRLLPRPQASARLAMVRSGEADMAFIDPRQATEAKKAGLRLLFAKGSTVSYLTFMGCWQENIWCHNTLFRKALVHAIDMKTIVERIFPEGTGVPVANSFWTEVALGFDRDLPLYDYDPEMARQILKEIGYDGTPAKLWSVPTTSSPEAPEIMELVDGYLRAAGFKTEITPLEFGAFRPRYASSPQRFETSYSIHLYVDTGGARPMVMQNLRVSYISQKAGGLIQSYWNLPKMDAEFARLRNIADLKKLDTELRKINRETWGEYPVYTIVARNVVAAVGPRVGTWTPSGYGWAWHIETVTQKR